MADEQQQEVTEQQEEVVETPQQETDPKQGDDPTPPEWGEDISPDKDGGLFKKVLVEGKGDEKPLQGDKAFVHYTGRLLSGKVFDSSIERNEPFSFQIGKGAYGEDQVIKGWVVGIQTMRKGEKCTLTCRPEYAYGEKGSPPDIPGNAILQFDIELLLWQGEDVTSDGGVLKSIVKEGAGYTRPSEGAQCNSKNGLHAVVTFGICMCTFWYLVRQIYAHTRLIHTLQHTHAHPYTLVSFQNGIWV